MIKKIVFSLLAAGLALFLHITRLNELTRLRLSIPPLEKEVHDIEEEINRLRYQLEVFNNPTHLIELARRPEYSHLKFPLVSDITIIDIASDIHAP